MSVQLEDEHGNFTRDPSHEDEPTYVHNDYVEQVKVLRRLHLVTANDQDGVVDAHRPSVTPLARFCLKIVDQIFLIQLIPHIVFEQAELVVPPEHLQIIIIVIGRQPSVYSASIFVIDLRSAIVAKELNYSLLSFFSGALNLVKLVTLGSSLIFTIVTQLHKIEHL